MHAGAAGTGPNALQADRSRGAGCDTAHVGAGADDHAANAKGTRPLAGPIRVAPMLDASELSIDSATARGRTGRSAHDAPGERTAIMGANGAGKTTLLRILATSTRPRHGTCAWCGTAVPRGGRRLIGFAADAMLDDPGLTGRQSTYFWCRQWAPGRDIHGAVEDALRRLGLADVADEPIAGYSFGMRRRLALAQALAHEPRIALLDEPTAGLDAEGTQWLGAEAHESRAPRETRPWSPATTAPSWRRHATG